MHEIRAPLTAYEDDPVFLTVWHVADGARVGAGEAIATIETAKATMEIMAPAAGTIQIVARPGEHRGGALLGRLLTRAPAAGTRVAWQPAEATTAPVKARSIPLSPRKLAEIRTLAADRAGQLPTTLAIDIPIPGLAEHLAAREEGPPLSIAAVVVHELARAIPRHPMLNACFTPAAIRVYEDVNVGVAIDALGRGLRVPVIRNADRLTLDGIAAALQLNLYRYLRDELTPAAMSGATITVSDLTADEIPWFLPLIPRGQAAIVGLGLDRRPAEAGGDLLRVIVTADHRVADGQLIGALLRDLAGGIRAHVAEAAAARPPRCARCGRDVRSLAAAGIALLRAVDETGGPAAVCAGCASGSQSVSST